MCVFFNYAGGPGPQIFIDVDNLGFVAGSSHSLTITLETEAGQSIFDTVQFVAVGVPETPSKFPQAIYCRCGLHINNITVLVNIGLDTGGTTVEVDEAGLLGSRPVLLSFTILGDKISDIPIRIVPVTYNEFEAMFSSSLLNELFPSRPINAASGINRLFISVH